ncbi:hypothetical protein K0M31_015597 [Melipona bicolor]|uniref:Uncharacterized protein n=1 Tax=Melipona bicolor TaxID=60889 RepID=A0AA40FFA1_9HYME|nr:hypothetical protein K0M31_015597 [Melipona bicolor]
MQEALDMTREEMDRAAHQLLLQERRGQPLSYQLQQGAEQQWLPAYQPMQPSQQASSGIGYQPLQEQRPPGPRQYHRSSYYRGDGQTAATSDSSQQQQQQPPPS